jgi:hypothetical protein
MLDVLTVCTQHDFAVSRLRVERPPSPTAESDGGDNETLTGQDTALSVEPGSPVDERVKKVATVVLEFQGVKSVSTGGPAFGYPWPRLGPCR